MLRRLLDIDPYGDLRQVRTAERLAKAASPRYLLAKARQLAHERLHPDEPWLTRRAVEMLQLHLRRDHRGMEYGSGRGTLWFARRVGHLVSIEHHAAWADKVRGLLTRAGLANVDYRQVSEDRYLAEAEGLPEGTLDFAVVDGLFRDRAALCAARLLKPGGWLIFDNVNWYLPSESQTPHSRHAEDGPAEGCAPVQALLVGWHTMWTTNGVNDTAVFVKPDPGGRG